MTVGGPSKFWVIPPEIYEPLKQEFRFNFDPCPFPKPDNFDGLAADWGTSNWVNPLFGQGITAWVRKAIAEQTRGKTSVVILPLDNWVKLFLDAGAEIQGRRKASLDKPRNRGKPTLIKTLFPLHSQAGGRRGGEQVAHFQI